MKSRFVVVVLITIGVFFCSCARLEKVAQEVGEPLQRIVFGSCMNTNQHPMLNRFLDMEFDLALLLGDNIYADTTNMVVMEQKYRAMKKSAFWQGLRKKAPLMATWDDHDMGGNDAGADYPLKNPSQKLFMDFLDEPAASPRRKQPGVYSARIFGPPGKRVQVILLDTRYFRSHPQKGENNVSPSGGKYMPHTDPTTTLLGAAQWAWLEEQLRVPADIRIIGSSIQFISQFSGAEAWANFPHEKRRMLDLLEKTEANGVVMISGDRHWAELSRLDRPGRYSLYDLTSSALTQSHPRGTPTPNLYREGGTYHHPNVGLISIDWAPKPVVTLQLFDVDGRVRIEKRIADLGFEPSCDPIRTFAEGKRPLHEIFVCAAGDNASADGSRAKPFASLARALEGVRPGDAIRLLPGRYAGGMTVANVSGAESAPIWIGGLPGEERPVINGGNGGIILNRVRYLVLENLEVKGASGNGINCDDGSDYANSNATRFVVFRNLFIHDIGTGRNNDGLKLSGVNDFHVLDSEFTRISSGGSAIDHVGCHRGLIARSSFTDCGNAVQCKGGSKDIEVRWNRFLRAGGRAVNVGGSTGFTFFRPPLSANVPNVEARNIRVLANVFEGSDAPVAFVGAVDCIAANNTIVNPARWIFRILQETNSKDGYEFHPCGNNEVANNIIWYQRGVVGTPVNIGGNTAPASFRFANNLWFAHDRPDHSQPELPVPEVNGIVGRDPKFKDHAGGNYHLESGSPALATGKRIPLLNADITERCYAALPSIGAFEADLPGTFRAN